MATKKSSSSSSKKTSTTRRSSSVSLNKISFYTICAVAILYLVGLILALVSTKLGTVVSILQGLATAIMICIVGILAWKYVRNRPTVWKVLYFVCLLVVIVGIIIPLVV